MNATDRIGIAPRYFVYLNGLQINSHNFPWIMIGQYTGHLSKEEALAFAKNTKARIKTHRTLTLTEINFTLKTKWIVTIDGFLAVGPMYDRGAGGKQELQFPVELRNQGTGWKKEAAEKLRLKMIRYLDDLQIKLDKKQKKTKKIEYTEYELQSAFKLETHH